MRRFQFRLQRLLDVRRYEEQQVQLRLGAATAAVVGIDQRLDAITAQRAVDLAGRGGHFETGSLLASERYLNRLDQERRRLLDERQQRAEELSVVLAEYAEVAQRRKVVDKLRERRERQFKRAQLRAEHAVTDELNNARAAAAAGAAAAGRVDDAAAPDPPAAPSGTLDEQREAD